KAVHHYVLVLAMDMDGCGSDAEGTGRARPAITDPASESGSHLTSTPEEEAAMVTPARAGTSIRTRPLPAEAFTDEATYLQTRLPVDLAATLIPDAYTSGEFFALERERV